MIQIAIKSKDPINQISISSINNTSTQSAFTAQNITALNTAALRKNAHAQPSVHVPEARHAKPAAVPSSAVARPAPATVPSSAAARPALAAPPSQNIPVAVPKQHKLPPLKNPVQKGQKTQLAASGMPPGILRACFGWNASNPQCDADVSAFLLGADGKVPGDSWFVFYGQTVSPDKSCRFEAGQEPDREIITIDFNKLHTDVKKIVFVLTINEAFAKRLHFGMMKDAYIRILDGHGAESASFQMTEYYSNVISMVIAEIYQYKGSWKFNAVGNGVAKDLAGLCALYGVNVSD